jgi:peptidoglycan/xylan/chitin deacetylase (PgdA/CDA1 family)
MQLPKPAKAAARRLWDASAALTGTVIGAFTREPIAALTFDDGPNPEATPQLLEILAAHGARATFFMVGRAARQHPELVAAVAGAGHAIGNHTWDHPSLPMIDRAAQRRQILRCREALGAHDQGLFRPPYGDQTPATQWTAARLGYRGIAWSATVDDWLDHPADVLLAKARSALRPGAILLFHDALFSTVDPRYCDRGPMLAAVDRLLAESAASGGASAADSTGGFEFVTVPELLARGRARKTHWYRRPDLEWQSRLA